MTSLEIRPTGSPLGTERHPVSVYLASLDTGSVRTMRGSLDTLARLYTGEETSTAMSVAWSALTYGAVLEVRQALASRYAPSTANKMLSALRGVVRTCWRLGLMSGDVAALVASVKNVRGSRLRDGRALTPLEVAALFDACAADTGPKGRRDAAVLALMYVGGLRRAEVATLTVGALEMQEGRLRFVGKRNVERVCYTEDAGVRAALDAWLMAYGSFVSLDASSPLFVAIDRHSHLRPAWPLSADAVYDLVCARSAQAGIGSVAPHDMRRTFVTELLERSGGDIAQVSRLAGHATIATTMRYDRRGEEAARKVAGLLHAPVR